MKKILMFIPNLFQLIFNKLRKPKIDKKNHDKNILIASQVGYVLITRMAEDRTFRRAFERKFPKETQVIDILMQEMEL